MRKHYLFASLVLIAASPAFAQTKIGAAGAPDGSAMLEVTSGTANNKGLLMPRMTTTQRNAITNPATGLMIYNTTTNQVQVNTGTPALPTWAVATATATGWATTGNTGTTPATNFIGTADNQPLVVRTNNTEKVRVTATGNVGIGTTTPVAKLQVVDSGHATIVVTSSDGGKTSVNLGNIHHGITRDLSEVGGVPNDVALFTTMANPNDPASIHLAVRKNVSDSLDMNQFVLKNTGDVGIGTGTPAVKLHIVDTGDVSMRIGNSGGTGGHIQLGNNNHGLIRDLTSSGGSINDVALYTSTGVLPGTNSSLYLVSKPTSDGSGNLPLDQFVLKNNGNVGIGTNTPAQKLHVEGTARIATAVGTPTTITGRNAAGDVGNVTLGSGLTLTSGVLNTTADNADWNLIGNTGTNPATNFIGTGDAQPLVIRTDNTEKVRVTAAGNVGIGVATPGAKLHVSDTGNVAIRVTSANANAAIMQLGNPNHGLRRNLTTSGGGPNDVAVFTSLGASGNADLYLISNSVGNGSDSLPLNQFVLKNNGNVGIGTGTPTAKLSVNGTTNNLSGTWGIFSDARVKTVDGEYEDGLATVMKIHPVKFHYNANAPFKSNEQQIGIIAQEMEQIAPYMVSKVNADGFTDLRQYNNQALPYMLVNAIQEQQAQIEALKAKNEQLEAENKELKASNKITAQLMERVKQMEQMMGINEIEGTSKVAGK